MTFKIEIIEGAEYGTIKNSETGEENTVFEGLSWEEIKTNIFTYYANGIQPDSTGRVTIRHSSSDADIQPQNISFTIKRNSIPPPSEGGSIYFQMDKKYVMPSDTVNLHLLWINEVNDTVEFLPMQRFRVEIAEGMEYGRLVDLESGIQGDDLNEASSNLQLIIENEIPVDLAKITLVAQADVLRFNRAIRGSNETQEEEAVEIHKNKKTELITPEFIIVGDHIVGIAEVTIDKYPVIVDIIPEEISAGDTAQIIIKKRNPDGSVSEFPAEQQFEAGMLEGCVLGKLSNSGIDTNYFYGVTQTIYFIADSSADSGIVKIRVGVIEMTSGNRSNKGGRTTEGGEYCFLNTFQTERYKDAELSIDKTKKILLGETKYFGVKKKTDTGELRIEEIKTNYGEEPEFPADSDGWEWLKTDVWGTQPIEILGTKSGVYWEKKWFDKTDNRNKDLEAGMIRLIGRYWEEGKEDSFKVKLKTKTDSEVELKVARPRVLGDNNHNPNDVFGSPINIDSVCIIVGGLKGIPPQIIKGQIQKETSFRNSFRYEPRIDIEVQNDKIKKKKYLDDYPYYTVTATSMGTIAIPSTHINVKPVPYVTAPTKISDYLVENINNYIGIKKDERGNWIKLYFVGYEKGKISSTINDIYQYALKILKKSKNDAKKYAIISLKEWLKTDQFEGYNKYLQSRIFSSYGMLQQIFYFACTDKIAGYSINNDQQSPESLNEIDYSIKAYKEKIGKKLMNKSDNQWENGFEEDWAIILRSYNNGESNYGKLVVEFSKQYLPKK